MDNRGGRGYGARHDDQGAAFARREVAGRFTFRIVGTTIVVWDEKENQEVKLRDCRIETVGEMKAWRVGMMYGFELRNPVIR